MSAAVPRQVISLDIGSTFTKGAVFSISGDGSEAKMVRRADAPTTVDHLPDGALSVLRELMELPSVTTWDELPVIKGVYGRDFTSSPEDWYLKPAADHDSESDRPEVYFSSSAKGGLQVAVLGLVPDLSLQIGRLAAWSAGARIVTAVSYGLTQAGLVDLEQKAPDILLFCGGTDGGHEKTGLENAEKLARSSFAGKIIYAGNNVIADRIAGILAKKQLVVTSNVMPDFGKLVCEPAREAIREVFLREIVFGKGLSLLVEKFGTEPTPTPRAMLDLVTAIGRHCPVWPEFLVIDQGGATTDVYSHSDAFQGNEGLVLRGVHEPRIKRSVEGDLGVRVSASSLLLAIEADLQAAGITEPFHVALHTWVGRISKNPSLLPVNDEEYEFDALLSAGCIRHAIGRHAGRLESAWTPDGKIWLQTGKDLRKVPHIVFTGGYPAANPDLNLYQLATQGPLVPPADVGVLSPMEPVCFNDQHYLWPLLGNLAPRFPVAAANLAVSCLKAPKAMKKHTSPPLIKESLHCERYQTAL